MQIHFNTTHLDILPTDESYRYRSIMGEHTLNLYFSLSTYTDIPTGAWCEFQGERYTLNTPAKITKHNSRNFEYTLTMDSEGANLKNFKFRNPNDKTLKFPFTASPRYHVQILVDCLNMIDSGWQVGNCIEANEKIISYNHNNCLEALDMVAKAFETEYEIIGKTIHLHKVEYFKDNPLPLQYGKGKGFKTGVTRNNEQSRITRLYVQGGDRNIDRSKYGNKELLLPKSQEYVYEGVTFLSDDKGLSIAIKNADNAGFVNEQSLDLSHIYPKRKGTVSQIFEVDKAKNFYDITDTTIPQALNFSDLQIKGEKMIIYFESGMLSGREFEVSTYDHTQKRFALVPKDEDGVTMPNDIFKPSIGDEYSVYNMQMPNAYISDNATKSGASWEMMKEACKYLYENRADLFTFTGDLDGIWAKKKWANVGGRLKMGAYINFSDNEFQRTPVPIRIVGLKEYVNNPYSPQIELSNKVQGQSFATEIRKIQNQEVYFGELNRRALSFTKRRWRDAQETIKQIEEAFPEYTKSILPVTVQTMMLLVGNKATQFDFVVSKANPIKAPHTLYFDKNTKQIHAGSGWLKHYTIGTTNIAPSHSSGDYKYWNISAFVSGRLDDKSKTYYLYIKASKNDEVGEFILSENTIEIEQEAGYYHFLYATVNSEYDNERGIAKLNGFTEITGGQLKTDKITSGNGQQYIELLDDRINIKANLQITDGNKTEIKQIINPDLQSLENKLKQYSDGKVETAKTATEAYARAQAELTKTQAIAAADGKITEAEQRQILQLQQKLQEAKTFAQQKVNELNIGGRNLLRNSGRKITNNSYLIAAYDITTDLKEGETVTLTLKGQLGVGKVGFSVHNSNGYVHLTNLENKGNGVYQSTFNWTLTMNGYTANNTKIEIYTAIHTVIVDSTIEWIKLERGNKPTDWSPAPEDLENKMADIQTDLKTAINNAKALIEAEKQNIKNSNDRIQKLENKTQIFSDTQIAGNVVATGTLIVGNTQGTKAGITGVGATNDSIRFWAGEPDKTQPIETPQQAEERRRQSAFLVQEDGTMITKKIKAEGGEITGRLKMRGSIYTENWNEKENKVISGSAYTGDGLIYREDDNDINAYFGGVAGNTYTATKSLMALYRKPKKPKTIGDASKFIGVDIYVPPHPTDFIDLSRYDNNRAMTINGDTVSFGAHANFDYGFLGTAYSNVIIDNIGFCHHFMFGNIIGSGNTNIYLPSWTQIEQKLSYLGMTPVTRNSGQSVYHCTFELHISLEPFVGGRKIRLVGSSRGILIDNNGNAFGGDYGYLEMGGGDAVILRFAHDRYTIMSLQI
ncbi:hypothetical protein RCZ04_04320 [Capnocytophaga sp. HP1101]